MLLIVKFKGLFSKKEKEGKHSQSKQVSTRTISSPRAKYASLIALANAAKGADAEQVFPRILMQAAYHKSVTPIRVPIGRGVPPGWFKHLVRQWVKPIKVNTVLRIESSKEGSALTLPSTMSTVANPCVSGGANIVSYPESSPNTDYTTTAPQPPVLLGTNTISNGDEVIVYAPTTVTTVAVVADPTQEDFELIKELGAGAFGTVFLARHKQGGVRVALKAIPKVPRSQFATDWNRAKLEERVARPADSETAMLEESALEEITALLRTRSQKGILQILASFHDLAYFYIATEYVSGGDLESELYRNGPFSVDRMRFYAADLLLGLETLQANKIVHRDLKPANLLIGQDGHLVIADLGLARSFGGHDADAEQIMAGFAPPPEVLRQMMGDGDGRNVTVMRCGTLEYIASEVYRKEEYTYPADVWAFGVIMYELLLKKVPWDVYWAAYEHLRLEDEERFREIVLNEEVVVTDRDRVHTNLSAQAEQFVLAALDKDQHRRPTPAQLRSHVFFDDFDWERHSSCNAPACWIPGASNTANELSPGDNSDFIAVTRVLKPDENCIPQFTFLSPLLSPASTPPSSLSPLPALESRPSLDVVLPVPQAPPLASGPSLFMVPSDASADVDSHLRSPVSSTVVGLLTALSSLISSTTANSPSVLTSSLNGALTKVKKWACKVW